MAKVFLRGVLGLLLILGWINVAAAATCTSRGNGYWSSSGFWSSPWNKSCGTGNYGPPAPGDAVVISGNNTVTLDTNTAALGSLTVNGTLTGTGGNTLTLNGPLVNNGSISLAGSTLSLSGDSAWSGTATGTAITLGSINLQWHNLTFAASTSYTIALNGASPLQNPGSFNNDGANRAVTLYLNGASQVFTTYTTVKYPNLEIGGSGTKTFRGSSIVILGNLTIDSGATFDVSAVTGGGSLAGNLTIKGSLTGTAVGGAGWALNGTSTQTITGATSFTVLAINNPAGVTLASGNMTIGNSSWGTLAFQSGVLTTGSNLLVVVPKCDQTVITGAGSGSWVNGNLRLTFPNYGVTCTYPVGDAAAYAPMTVVFPTYTGIVGGTLTGSTTAGQHPQIGTSGIDWTNGVNRYWSLGASGDTLTSLSSNGSYNVLLNFNAGDVQGNGVVSTFEVARYSSGSWLSPAGSATGTQASLPGQTGFGSFVVGPASSCVAPVGSPAGMTCFCDNFDRTAGLGADWTSYCVNGCSASSFPGPSIVGNRLRLTDHLNNLSTAVTLQRYFPAASNYISLEFNYFAWDTSSGTGADGVAFILSDASITPQPGAFGGSLGYAQKTGINGFAGGWIGVGLDEYGNYANSGEGRTGSLGGCATSLCPNRVSVRGSGSGTSGYAFLTGSSPLSPNLDTRPVSSAGRGYRYQVIVDARGALGKASVSVNQDSSGTGNSYSSIISSFDLFSVPTSGQKALPSKWLISMTGSTGGSVNYHEVDSLKICATKMQSVVNQIDHFEFIWDGSQCPPLSSVRVRACLDAVCSTTYTGNLPVTFSTSGWSGGQSQTLSSGDVYLSYAGAAGDTLGVLSSSPAVKPYSLAVCKTSSGATRPCTLSCSSRFNACHSDSTCSVASGRLYTRLANQPFALNISALKSSDVVDTTFNGSVQASLVGTINGGGSNDANNCPVGTVDLNQSLGNVSLNKGSGTIGNNATGSSIVVPNAYRDVRVKIVCDSSVCSPSGITSCSSDNFAIRPDNFDLQVPSAGVLVAGDSSSAGTFALTATATAGSGTGKSVITDYNGTPQIDPAKVVAMNSGPNNVGAIGGAFPVATAGVSIGSTFTYSEAGYFAINPQAVYDGAFAAVDSGNGDCVASFSNALANTSDKLGCYFGNTVATPSIGRFRPARFEIDSDGFAPACPTGSFTYMGQPFATPSGSKPFMRLRAVNQAGAVTTNYDGSYAYGKGAVSWLACNQPGASCGANLGGRLAPAPGVVWAQGFYTVATPPSFAKLPQPDGPYDALRLGVLVVDSDKVTVSPVNLTTQDGMNGIQLGGAGSSTRVRYGRLKFANAYGSELLALPMGGETQYWVSTSGGGYWRTNAEDNCTILSSSAIPYSNFTGNLSACETQTCLRNASNACVSSMAALAGQYSLMLAAPGAGNIGGVTLGYNTGASGGGVTCQSASSSAATAGNLPWLAPVQPGQAAFGAFRQRGVIYQREVF